MQIVTLLRRKCVFRIFEWDLVRLLEYEKMGIRTVLTILMGVSIAIVSAQRGHYAGARPGTNFEAQAQDLANRLGSDGSTTPRLPYDAYGDAIGVQLAQAKPIEHQPFWLINQAAIEAHRGGDQRRPTPANGLVNRFGESEVRPGEFDPSAINKVSQQEIVYPVNVPQPAATTTQSAVRPQSQSTQSVQQQTALPTPIPQQSQQQQQQQRPNQVQQQQQPSQSQQQQLLAQQQQQFLEQLQQQQMLNQQFQQPTANQPRFIRRTEQDFLDVAPYFSEFDY